MPQKIQRKNKKGFSLIELMVAMFIFVLLMGAMVAVSVAGFRSYGKSKAIKIVTEDVGFALNSITKDVRMGKIESANTGNSPSDKLIITRNSSQATVRYQKTNEKLSVCSCGIDKTCASPTDCKDIVDLSSTGMSFSSNSGFYSMSTSDDTVLPPNKIRGWAEINLNIENLGMDTDLIRVQTIVSSRDYGWEEL